MREPIHETVPEADWEKLRPTLDDAMHELKETDREAILLRYFERRQFVEVGAKLGLNENAARMRVERALEKLRDIFTKRGVTTVTALASVISANAVQIAPANLAATLAATSIAAAGTGTFTLLKIMTATKLKLGISALVVAGAAATLVIQHQAQVKMREENGLLQQQIAQLQTDNESLSNRLTMAGDSQKLPEEQFNELLKLRGEVGILRQQINQFKKMRDEQVQRNQEAGKLASVNKANLDDALTEGKFNADEIHGVSNVKQISLAIRIFAGDNANQCPTNFDQLANEFGSTNLMAFAQSEVEILNSQTPNLNETYPQAVQLRERTARKDMEGNWRRIYGFADGSVHVAVSLDGDFDAWEKANTYSPPRNQ